jgi:hypothetical protein
MLIALLAFTATPLVVWLPNKEVNDCISQSVGADKLDRCCVFGLNMLNNEAMPQY